MQGAGAVERSGWPRETGASPRHQALAGSTTRHTVRELGHAISGQNPSQNQQPRSAPEGGARHGRRERRRAAPEGGGGRRHEEVPRSVSPRVVVGDGIKEPPAPPGGRVTRHTSREEFPWRSGRPGPNEPNRAAAPAFSDDLEAEQDLVVGEAGTVYRPLDRGRPARDVNLMDIHARRMDVAWRRPVRSPPGRR